MSVCPIPALCFSIINACKLKSFILYSETFISKRFCTLQEIYWILFTVLITFVMFLMCSGTDALDQLPRTGSQSS